MSRQNLSCARIEAELRNAYVPRRLIVAQNNFASIACVSALWRASTRLCAASPMHDQNISRRIKTGLHDARQCFNIARRHEPTVLTRLNELRDSGHEGADDRSPERHCLHDDYRKSLRKAWQHKRPRGQDFVTHLLATDPPRDAHPCPADC